jgi:predicted nucleotidyltransferase
MAGSVTITEEELRIVDAILTEHVPDAAVWAFGSRVTGRARPYSDLDLVIETDEPLRLAAIAALREAFTESELPWKVDLLDWSTISDDLRAEIRSQRVLLPTPAPAV